MFLMSSLACRRDWRIILEITLRTVLRSRSKNDDRCSKLNERYDLEALKIKLSIAAVLNA